MVSKSSERGEEAEVWDTNLENLILQLKEKYILWRKKVIAAAKLD